MKKQITITIDEDIVLKIDKCAQELSLNRSQLIQNCLDMALMDIKILRFFGLIDLAEKVQSIKDNIGIKKYKFR